MLDNLAGSVGSCSILEREFWIVVQRMCYNDTGITMGLTITLPQDLEKRLREQSVRAGLDAANFALLAIEEKLRQEVDSVDAAPASEIELLERINLGIPEP